MYRSLYQRYIFLCFFLILNGVEGLSIRTFFFFQAQYHDGIKVLEAFSKYRIRVDVSHLRPVTSVSDDPGVWWRYAFQAGLQQKKLWYYFI